MEEKANVKKEVSEAIALDILLFKKETRKQIEELREQIKCLTEAFKSLREIMDKENVFEAYNSMNKMVAIFKEKLSNEEKPLIDIINEKFKE